MTTGLTFISEQTVSAVSSVPFNNVFTSDYYNYLIVSDLAHSSGFTYLNARLRASGVDATGASDYITQRNRVYNTSLQGSRVTQDRWHIALINLDERNLNMFNIARPWNATQTAGFNIGTEDQSGTEWVSMTFTHTLSSSYDGINFYVGGGTITGNIQIYGYTER